MPRHGFAFSIGIGRQYNRFGVCRCSDQRVHHRPFGLDHGIRGCILSVRQVNPRNGVRKRSMRMLLLVVHQFLCRCHFARQIANVAVTREDAVLCCSIVLLFLLPFGCSIENRFNSFALGGRFNNHEMIGTCRSVAVLVTSTTSSSSSSRWQKRKSRGKDTTTTTAGGGGEQQHPTRSMRRRRKYRPRSQHGSGGGEPTRTYFRSHTTTCSTSVMMLI